MEEALSALPMRGSWCNLKKICFYHNLSLKSQIYGTVDVRLN